MVNAALSFIIFTFHRFFVPLSGAVGMPPTPLRLTLFSPLLLFLLTAGTVCGTPGTDYIQVHSVFPPILRNFWEHGMRFWSFGLNTVVTDNYIRLTEGRRNVSGYIWNRHSNRMEAFELNATLQVQRHHRDSQTTASEGSGMAIWYTTVDRFTRNETQFFGFRSSFTGVGVLLTHADEISLVVNNGTTTIDTQHLTRKRHGYCRVPRLGSEHLTITLQYTNQTFRVLYTVHFTKKGREQDTWGAPHSTVLCTTGPAPPLDSSYYFGVTAANTGLSQAAHELRSIIMTPLSNITHHAEEESLAAQARLFKEDNEVTQELSD